MCLTPVIIVNRTYAAQCNNYPYLHMNGRNMYYTHNIIEPFDYSVFNFRRFGVTFDNIDNYFATNMVGECIPVYMTVPCGHCVECIKQRQTQLLNRMLCEQIGHGSIRPLFFTLTYNNENLPADGSVSVSDIRDFFNRFYLYVRRLGCDGDVRHIYFSEYCPSSGRPHYHGLIYGFDVLKYFPGSHGFLDFISWFEKTWGKGFVNIKHFEPHGFKYVSKYLLKANNVPAGCKPNFWCGSRSDGGIGSRSLRCDEFVHAVLDSGCRRFKFKILGEVHTICLPKYLRDKLYPTLSGLISERIRSTIKRLVFNLATVQAYEKIYHSPLFDDYDYLFPAHLVEKFPFYSHLFDINFVNSDAINRDFLMTLQPARVHEEIVNDIKFLDSVHVDIDEIVSKVNSRNVYMAAFMVEIRKYLESLPPANDRRVTLYNEYYGLLTKSHAC